MSICLSVCLPLSLSPAHPPFQPRLVCGQDGDTNRMDFDGDEKMRKSGRLKGRHVGPGAKHAAGRM